MSNLQQICYYILILFILFMAGYPLLLFGKKDIQKNWVTDVFGVGTSLLIVVLFWISWIGGEYQKYGWPVAFAILILFVFSCVKRKKKCKECFKQLGKKDIAGLLICFLAGLLPLTIYLMFKAIFPYCDGYTYLCNADYLLANGYRTAVDKEAMVNHPWLSQMFIYQVNHFRIGSQMLLSWFTAIFRTGMSIEVYLPVLGAGVFLCGVAALGFGREENKFTDGERICICLFTAFNIPIIFWIAAYGFMPQLLGSAIIILVISRFTSIREWKKDRKWYIGTEMLFISAFALTYSEMLPFFVLLAGCVLASILIIDKKKFKETFINSILCAAGTAVIILPYLGGMIKAIFSQLGAVVGWDQSKSFRTYAAYFLSTIAPDTTLQMIRENWNFSSFLTVVFSAFLACALLFGIYRVVFRKKEKGIIVETITVSLPYLLLIIYYAFAALNPFGDGRGNSWSLFKVMQYAFVAVVPYIGFYIYNGMKGINKKILVVLGLLFVLFNVKNAIAYQEVRADDMVRVTGNEDDPLNQYYKLMEKYNDDSRVIYLSDNIDGKHRQMVTYFMKNNRLLSDWSTDGYFSSIPQVSKDEGDICLVYGNEEDAIANLMEREYLLQFNSGFYDEERDEKNVWRWCQKESELSLSRYIRNENKLNTLVFDVWPVGSSDNKLVINAEGSSQSLEYILSGEDFTHIEIPLAYDGSSTKLRMEFKGKLEMGNQTDPRELAYRISNWMVR